MHRVHVERPAGDGFFNSDVVRYDYPNAVYLHGVLSRGRLPSWNPYQMAGMPLLGLHQLGTLYPPTTILTAILPPARSRRGSSCTS